MATLILTKVLNWSQLTVNLIYWQERVVKSVVMRVCVCVCVGPVRAYWFTHEIDVDTLLKRFYVLTQSWVFVQKGCCTKRWHGRRVDLNYYNNSLNIIDNVDIDLFRNHFVCSNIRVIKKEGEREREREEEGRQERDSLPFHGSRFFHFSGCRHPQNDIKQKTKKFGQIVGMEIRWTRKRTEKCRRMRNQKFINNFRLILIWKKSFPFS